MSLSHLIHGHQISFGSAWNFYDGLVKMYICHLCRVCVLQFGACVFAG